MIRMGFVLMVAALISGCSSQPTTPEGFRSLSRGNNGFESLTVSAPLETVMLRIRKHAAQCNNFGYSINMGGVGGYHDSDRQLTRWEAKDPNNPTFIVFMAGDNRMNRPDQGFFQHVIDLERKGTRTFVKLYDLNRPTTYEFNDEFRRVVAGKKAICQVNQIH